MFKVRLNEAMNLVSSFILGRNVTYVRSPGEGQQRARKRLMAKFRRNHEEEQARIAEGVRRRRPTRQVRRRQAIVESKIARHKAKIEYGRVIRRKDEATGLVVTIRNPGGMAAVQMPKTAEGWNIF